MTNYHPILRNSDAEMLALSEYFKIKPGINDPILPIIELKHKFFSQVDKEPKFNTTGSYLRKKLGNKRLILQFSTTFPNNEEAELASQWENEDGKNAIELIQHFLKQSNISYYPCVFHNDPQWIFDELQKKEYSKVFVRIRVSHLIEAQDNKKLAEIHKKMLKEFKNSQFVYILDFYNKLPSFSRADKMIDLLNSFGSEVIFCATTCPEKADEVDAASFVKVSDRDDFEMFKDLRKKYPKLGFSDYTVRLKPEPPTKEKKRMNASISYFKIFYSTENSYMIAKSDLRRDINLPDKQDQHSMCESIVSSQYFFSKDFSWGDEFIFECSKNNSSFQINDHKKPISIGINHHLHVVASQL